MSAPTSRRTRHCICWIFKKRPQQFAETSHRQFSVDLVQHSNLESIEEDARLTNPYRSESEWRCEQETTDNTRDQSKPCVQVSEKAILRGRLLIQTSWLFPDSGWAQSLCVSGTDSSSARVQFKDSTAGLRRETVVAELPPRSVWPPFPPSLSESRAPWCGM